MSVAVLGEDPAVVCLSEAALALRGAHLSHRSGGADRALAALSRGELEHLVWIGPSLPDSLAEALRAQPALARRTVLRHDQPRCPPVEISGVRVLSDTSTAEELSTAVLGNRPMNPMGDDELEIDARGMSALEILGRSIALEPMMELRFEGDEQTIALRLAGGQLCAISSSVAPIAEQEPLRSDRSLGLVISLCTDKSPASTTADKLRADLDLVSGYGDLFAASPVYQRYAAEVLATLLHTHPRAMHVSASSATGWGMDLAPLMRAGLEQLSPEVLRPLAGGGGALAAPNGLPQRLKTALPARHFGRLFFVLEEGASLNELFEVSARLTPVEVLAALALGCATGAIRRVAAGDILDTIEREAIPAQLHGDGPPPVPPPLPGAHTSAAMSPPSPEPELSERSAPATTDGISRQRQAERVFPKTLHGMGSSGFEDQISGNPQQYLESLREAHRIAQEKGKRIRLRGTRFEPIGEVFGDLALFYRVGAGGMGEVFLGVRGGHASFQKVIAVKRMNKSLTGDSQRLDMFLAEARLTATLQHPNIVQIFQLVRHAKDYLLLMEFVHGLRVSELIRQLGRVGRLVPIEVVRRVGAEAARALFYAHHHVDDAGRPLGLVHRDVAPDNILLGFDGSVKLIDFGIARSHSDRLSVVGEDARSGRLQYMAPEMLAGEQIGPHSDQFSLGAALYETLTGVSPFGADVPAKTIAAIAGGRYTPLMKRRPDIPAQLAYAVERAMATQPSARFEDCGALRSALLAGVPGDHDPTSELVLTLDEVLGEERQSELKAIARMRRCAASVLRTDSRRDPRPRPPTEANGDDR